MSHPLVPVAVALAVAWLMLYSVKCHQYLLPAVAMGAFTYGAVWLVGYAFGG